jgi:predicted adenylyl cyclase CyaB
MAQFEIEIKTLLGEKANAEALINQMLERDPSCAQVSANKQLNHYFTDGDIQKLYEETQHLFSDEVREKFRDIVERGSSFSVRTRQKDESTLFVVKASVDAGTSFNTVSRLEFEEEVPLSLDELDALILNAGFTYQAKWSREREEYAYKGLNVCIDKNAGYGYLAEFEKVIHDESIIADVREEIDAIMQELGVFELPQDRLERMFEFYNQNWPEYYGTDKTFFIE